MAANVFKEEYHYSSLGCNIRSNVSVPHSLKPSDCTSSEELRDWTVSMLSECDLKHVKCGEWKKVETKVLPTRLIDLGKVGAAGELQLVSSKHLTV
jgi:hypothetical protein